MTGAARIGSACGRWTCFADSGGACLRVGFGDSITSEIAAYSLPADQGNSARCRADQVMTRKSPLMAIGGVPGWNIPRARRFRANGACAGASGGDSEWLQAHASKESVPTDQSSNRKPCPCIRSQHGMPTSSESVIAQRAASAADPFTHNALEENLAEGIRDFPSIGLARLGVEPAVSPVDHAE